MIGIPLRWPELPEWALDLMLAGAVVGIIVYLGSHIVVWQRGRKRKPVPASDGLSEPVSVYALMVEENQRDPEFDEAFLRVARAVEELGSRGDIEVWGRRDPAGRPAPIPRSYWEFHRIEPTSYMKGSDQGVATHSLKRNTHEPNYDYLLIPHEYVKLVRRFAQSCD